MATKNIAKPVEKKAEKTQETNVEVMRQQLAKLHVEHRVGKLKDVKSISKLRDQIARVLTAQRIKELGAA